jgi:hypothetical protein
MRKFMQEAVARVGAAMRYNGHGLLWLISYVGKNSVMTEVLSVRRSDCEDA